MGFGMMNGIQVVTADERASYDAHGKRDPFVPLVTETSRNESSALVGVESVDEVRIEGIVYDAKKGSVVIMNGALLKEGEDFGSVRVVKIRQDGVLFAANGTEVFKPMYDEETKKGE